MARMKFLCDADRCIECNACVTACKNEHEVPWGINRRRVVTINDGKPGERSVSMACMHCTDAPCAAVCPVNCFYTTADGVVLHSKDLCIGCGYCFYACPFGAPQYPQGRQLRFARQDGQVHLLRRRPGGRRQQGRVREIRRQPSRRRQAAAVRRDVLDQVAARRRRRHHRADLQGARGQARLRLRRLGLEDRLSRDRSQRNAQSARERSTHRRRTLVSGQKGENAHDDICREVSDSSSVPSRSSRWRSAHTRQALSSLPRSIRQASAVKEQQLLQQFKMIQGRGTIPDTKSYVLEQPAGREWREFTNVTLHWIGGIAILGMLALLDDLLSIARHDAHRGRTLGPQNCAIQRVRAFRALDDCGHASSSSASPGSTSPSAAAAFAADGAGGVYRMVGMGEVCA